MILILLYFLLSYNYLSPACLTDILHIINNLIFQNHKLRSRDITTLLIYRAHREDGGGESKCRERKGSEQATTKSHLDFIGNSGVEINSQCL